jgi:hypothetical protein
MWKKAFALALGALLPVVVGADPQPVHQVANLHFQQGAWTYHAVYAQADGLARVDNVVALADPGALSGSNLAGVW